MQVKTEILYIDIKFLKTVVLIFLEMIGETYPFLSVTYIPESDILTYIFLSYGDETILKAIAYTPIDKEGKKYYNWGFGDLILTQEGKYRIDDRIESNNGDIKIVLYTVISTLAVFFNIHPDATIYIEGSNPQRTAVYTKLIERHRFQIEPMYEIFGCGKDGIEIFQPGSGYRYLLICRRKVVDL